MIIVCSLLLINLSGCNSAKVDELHDQVIQLTEEKEQVLLEKTVLEDELEQKKEEIANLQEQIVALETRYDISIVDVNFISENIYKEGELAGKLYGNFNVSVSIKNNIEEDIGDIKITAKIETSNANYPKSQPKTTAAKMDIVKELKAGEEKEVLFSDFSIDHPEVIQELILNVIDRGEIVKIKLPKAFPPGSQD